MASRHRVLRGFSIFHDSEGHYQGIRVTSEKDPGIESDQQESILVLLTYSYVARNSPSRPLL